MPYINKKRGSRITIDGATVFVNKALDLNYEDYDYVLTFFYAKFKKELPSNLNDL